MQAQLDESRLDTMLLKPVKPSDLFNVIMNLFGTTGSDKAHRTYQKSDNRVTISLSGRRVLVVEDSALNRDVAVALLEDIGIAVDIAENGRVAVDKVTRSPKGSYDIVLMDIQMPEMDGYEATRQIREWEAGLPSAYHQETAAGPESPHIEAHASRARIPIIALTAHAMKGEKQKCLDADMDDYLPKPIDEQELHRKLGRWIAS